WRWARWSVLRWARPAWRSSTWSWWARGFPPHEPVAGHRPAGVPGRHRRVALPGGHRGGGPAPHGSRLDPCAYRPSYRPFRGGRVARPDPRGRTVRALPGPGRAGGPAGLGRGAPAG